MENEIIIMPRGSSSKGSGDNWKSVDASEMELSTCEERTSKRPAVKGKRKQSKRNIVIVGVVMFIAVAIVSMVMDSSIFPIDSRENQEKKPSFQVPSESEIIRPISHEQNGEISSISPSVEPKTIEGTNQDVKIMPAVVPNNPLSPNQANQSPQLQHQNIIPGNVVESHTPFTEHVHGGQLLTFTYPTMGMHQPGSSFNFTQVKSNEFIEYESQMIELLRPYNDTDCILERYGDEGDGGYLMCNNFVNQTVALVNLGVEGRDMFGCQVTSIFPMPNLQFDCTNNRKTECPTNKAANNFELACLSDKSQNKNGVQFYSLKDIVDNHNLTHKHVTMKIDIEGAQWPGFRAFPIEYLDYVDQFILEIHNPYGGLRHQAYWGNLEIIKSLQQKFVSVNLHSNTGACYPGHEGTLHKLPAFAIQVSLVNRKLINLKSKSRSYALHPKNRLNGGGINCQLRD